MNTILLANDMAKGSRLSIGKKLLLPNPTKAPNKVAPAKIATTSPTKPPQNPTTTKPVQPAPVKTTAVGLKVAVKKEVATDPQVITYGDYTLSLKVTKGCRNFVW